ncbi:MULTISPECIES: DUF6059 family protein [unclassified Streptomyces]|jgi:hypothetical protein|uniref:DUF6059 family protein n=1 Tax=unclassified Streptomyces TaxID=2593676 RepID=UPI002259B71A|nr:MULTISPECIES: DUF6059 family protein [unclassified Streptomyces]MCX4816697.1 hypothetical protein [Streptomyces sp. NBC_01239]MCX4818086.1 hypothetical protein [Streptomyces sp. NBC_01239]MCX4818276.1 hypothetical protein [Streptomyces sp. NBC_01239]
MGRVPRGGRRALADYVVRRLWLSLVAFGASYEPLAQQAAQPGRRPVQRPGGPPPAHPERLREDVALSEQEVRILRELWPAGYAGHRAPDRRT